MCISYAFIALYFYLFIYFERFYFTKGFFLRFFFSKAYKKGSEKITVGLSASKLMITPHSDIT
jgi:hypothetical protein